MRGQILAAFCVRRPAIKKSVRMVAQIVADLQGLSGSHSRLLRGPTLPLRLRDGLPIPPGESHDVLSPHQIRIAKVQAVASRGIHGLFFTAPLEKPSSSPVIFH